MLVHREFEKAYNKSIDGASYYSKKYAYLKSHGFFAPPKTVSLISLSEETVRQSTMQISAIIFEVTDACNLQCKYCAYGELYEGYDLRNRGNIDIDKAKKTLKYIYDLGAPKLRIGFYGGEPLLNMHFIKDLVCYVNDLNAGKEVEIEYSLTTNGTTVHKYIDFIVAHKFLLLLSLDGNEKNHSYRVFKNKRNSFKKVVENIDMIKRDYPEYFTTNVGFTTVLHDRNSVKDIYEFIYTRYNKIPQISELALDNIKPEKRDVFMKIFNNRTESEAEYKKDDFNLLPQVTEYSALSIESADFFDKYSINYYVSNLMHLFNSEEKYYPSSTCVPFSKGIFLTNRNKLLYCQNIDYKYSPGSIGKDIMIDIPAITRKYNYYYDNLKKVCQHCYAYKYCGRCMFDFENLDKVDTEGFVCEGFYTKERFQNKLSRIFSFLEKYPVELSHRTEDKAAQV